MIYKVWIEIEEIEEENDHYVRVGEPVLAGRSFNSQEAAQDLVDVLEKVGVLCK